MIVLTILLFLVFTIFGYLFGWLSCAGASIPMSTTVELLQKVPLEDVEALNDWAYRTEGVPDGARRASAFFAVHREKLGGYAVPGFTPWDKSPRPSPEEGT